MDPPFTKINMTMFLTYVMIFPMAPSLGTALPVSKSKRQLFCKLIEEANCILGAITFNTSMAIVSSYESVRILYPPVSAYVKKSVMKNHNISGMVYEFIDFIAHIFPVLYLIKVRQHWGKYADNPLIPIISLAIHGLWVKLVPKHYNLSRVYMYGNTELMNDNQWLQLWLLAFFGHFTSFSFKTSFKKKNDCIKCNEAIPKIMSQFYLNLKI